MLKSFKELRENLLVEKDIKSFKVGKNVVKITANKNKFAVFINGEKLDDSFTSAGEAEKNAKDFIKLMGEELDL